MTDQPIYLGNQIASFNQKATEGELVELNGESYYKISNSDQMRPFFMSLISHSDHWMFISSNGGLTAGRKNSDFALFPYYTDDRITESIESTGSKTILKVTKDGKTYLWEPYAKAHAAIYRISQNLYKNAYGNKLIFEEINEDLEISYRYEWKTSDTFGFIKEVALSNQGSSELAISVVDGFQNILPYGVGEDLQKAYSNLIDAYKRSELKTDSGLGIFALSAIIVDKAEPSEALKCNIAWSKGLDTPTHLVSSKQLDAFRQGHQLQEETDIKAERGAYFVQSDFGLKPTEKKQWIFGLDVNKNANALEEIAHKISNTKDLLSLIEKEVEAGTQDLLELANASDAIQLTQDKLSNNRHFANTLFNIMRGGIFDNNYTIEKWDFDSYLQKANKEVYVQADLSSLEDTFTISQLQELVAASDDPHFKRLCFEYMPLKFSRRHGDPSRPWNKFSINTRNEVDGSKVLDYQGNWRDIFQNWEALSLSYPEFIESMIHKFLNATTFDGYNPYRVTKDGFDWETIEEDDPWSYIGYWGDHQIIYLQKFLEVIENLKPGRLASLFNKDLFVYANVPYKIKGYADILKNPKDTIDFDFRLDEEINERRDKIGVDGALLYTQENKVYTVNFVEKILATVLAKISNFIPEAGIWLNTQRPEWNDANNALVGNGVSMVTLYYLRRFLSFFNDVIENSELKETQVSEELLEFYSKITLTLSSHKNLLKGTLTDAHRKTIMDGLGNAGSTYRNQVYTSHFSGKKKTLSTKNIADFISSALLYIDHTIDANKRADNLYHAYNLMTVENDKEVSISYLSEMLEGQVSVLSAGYLSSQENLAVLDAMKKSALFRDDQYSYILYPNKDLPKFLEKNQIPESAVKASKLLQKLLADDNKQIILKDRTGVYHFSGNFKNANDLSQTLTKFESSEYGELIKKERDTLLDLYETVFNHKAFTGRSGTFFGYEGLGSIYWHMVSKLALAAQECCLKAIREEESPETIGRLLEHYYEICEGIGVHKSPTLYGAFPTDPYSHTPGGKGAQQPGMTGQVKEDILSRFGELGVFVKEGKLAFAPDMLRKAEFLKQTQNFSYIDVTGKNQQLEIKANSLCFTYCQVPVIYTLSAAASVEIQYTDNSTETVNGQQLDNKTSSQIFGRSGEIARLYVNVNEAMLK